MNKIYLPTVGPQDWQKLLADPEKQWRTGYSARTIAYAWEAAKGHFPPEVERIFSEAGDERVGNLEILLEFPEWKVYLPPAGHTSQNDLFSLANGEAGFGNDHGRICQEQEGVSGASIPDRNHRPLIRIHGTLTTVAKDGQTFLSVRI